MKTIPRSRQFGRRKQRRGMVLAGLLTLCAAVLLTMSMDVQEAAPGSALLAAGATPVRVAGAGGSLMSGLVYPHSLVPGGVRSIEEFRARVAGDAALTAHYEGFDLSKARFEPAGAAKFVHVSYLLPGGIFWTSRRMQLAKGELLITDGENYARARCANRISDKLEQPISTEEPPVTLLDTPEEEPPVSGTAVAEDSQPLVRPGKAADTELGEMWVSEATPVSGGGSGSGGMVPGPPMSGGGSGGGGGGSGTPPPEVPADSSTQSAGFLLVCGAVLVGFLVIRRM